MTTAKQLGLHTLIRTGARKSKRVGRGQSSGKGKTSGRGIKGQNARAGRKKRPELRDIIKKLPKRRGYGKNRSHTVNTRLSAPMAVSLARLDTLFASGATVSHTSFPSRVKIVSGGELTKALTLKGVAVSASAKVAIEKAGGSVA